MKPKLVFKARSSDHALAVFTRFMFGAMGIAAGILIVRSIPDLVRYVKMERM